MPDLHRDLSSQIYSVLRDRIVDLRLKPGQRIDISALAQEFDISPSPVKTALKRLSQEGLIADTLGKGYYVMKLTVEKTEALCDMRKMFELHALKAAMGRISSTKLQRFKQELERLREEPDWEKKAAKSYQYNWVLHGGLIENSGNELLQKFYREIYHLVRISTHLYRIPVETSLEEHIAIVEALCKKDSTKARKALTTHLDRGRRMVIKALKKGLPSWESPSTQAPYAEEREEENQLVSL